MNTGLIECFDTLQINNALFSRIALTQTNVVYSKLAFMITDYECFDTLQTDVYIVLVFNAPARMNSVQCLYVNGEDPYICRLLCGLVLPPPSLGYSHKELSFYPMYTDSRLVG